MIRPAHPFPQLLSDLILLENALVDVFTHDDLRKHFARGSREMHHPQGARATPIELHLSQSLVDVTASAFRFLDQIIEASQAVTQY